MSDLELKNFPSTSKSDWVALAANQLKNDDPISQLQWHIEPSIQVDPYYDASDLQGLEYLTNFFQNLRPFDWKLYQKIEITDEKTANQMALEALEGGCDGVIFQSTGIPKTELLLNGIITDICDISFVTSADLQASHEINKLNGFVTSKNHRTAYQCSENASAISQIVDIISGVSQLGYVTRTSFKDFFLEIATIRSIRFLLQDHLTLDPNSVHIHSSIQQDDNDDHQWFLNTTAGLASILGGSNSIDFHEAKGSARISRNVGNLIREESGIKTYSDQCGGSYYLETLTHALIEESKKQLSHA